MTGFQSPNYTQTPNDLFDDLLPELGLAELKVLLCVVRHTFGFHQGEVKLSIRTIARATGLTANSVMDGARQAEAHGLLERTVDGNKTTVWRAVVSVVPSKTPRLTSRDAGVLPAATLVPVKESNKENKKDSLSEKEKAQVNAKVNAIIEGSKKFKYPHREKFPETLVEYADEYVRLTGQEPLKRTLVDWLSTFSEWQGMGLKPEHIRQAYADLSGWTTVTRPGRLTETAYALKSKPTAPHIDDTKVEETRQMLEEKAQVRYVPPPPGLRPKFAALVADKSVKG